MTAADEYSAYLRSAHWRHLRKRYKKERPWRCAVCKTTSKLELHHKTYERRGAELLDDLVPLCVKHHALLHDLARKGKAELDPAVVFKRERHKSRFKSETERLERAAIAQDRALRKRQAQGAGSYRERKAESNAAILERRREKTRPHRELRKQAAATRREERILARLIAMREEVLASRTELVSQSE